MNGPTVITTYQNASNGAPAQSQNESYAPTALIVNTFAPQEIAKTSQTAQEIPQGIVEEMPMPTATVATVFVATPFSEEIFYPQTQTYSEDNLLQFSNKENSNLQGNLKIGIKQHSFTAKSKEKEISTSESKLEQTYLCSKSSISSNIYLNLSLFSQPIIKKETPFTLSNDRGKKEVPPKQTKLDTIESTHTKASSPKTFSKNETKPLSSFTTKPSQESETIFTKLNPPKSKNNQESEKKHPSHKRELEANLKTHLWKKEENSQTFWETRYHQKEREGRGGQQDSQQQKEGSKQGKRESNSKKIEKNVSAPFQPSFPFLPSSKNVEVPTDSNLDEHTFSHIPLQAHHFAVLLLIFELFKLMIRSHELNILSRREERIARLQHIEKLVTNLKEQARNRLLTAIGSGSCAIISGLCPVVMYAWGDKIHGALSHVFTSLKGMNPDKFGKSIEKLTASMSKIQEATGQVQDSFAQSSQTHDEHHSRVKEHDEEDITRRLRDNKEDGESMLRFILEYLSMYEKSTENLYR